MSGPQIVDWWRYYQAEPWGEERADVRLEVFRRRLTATDEQAHEVPSWSLPYKSLTSENVEESPAEFNARMKRRYEEIQQARAGAK